MTDSLLDKLGSDSFHNRQAGLPGWAWPVIGLVAGLALVAVVHGYCFIDPTCD